MSETDQSNTSSKSNTELAIAYLRVSTEEQERKGLSIEHQRKMALSYIEEYNRKIDFQLDSSDEKKPKIKLDNNWILVEVKPASKVFSDSVEENLSDTLRKRPVLQHIIELAETKAFKHLIIYSRDRLSRDFEQFIALKYLFKRTGIEIHYGRPGENLNIEDEKINRFIDNIMASVAELEANTIGIRVKSGGRLCVKKGNWPGGKPPFGYILKSIKVKGRKHNIAKLEPSILERSYVSQVFSLYSDGYSYKEIANKMNNMHKENIWTKSKVEKIIKNQTYTGQITWNRRGGRRHPNEKYEFVQSDPIDNIKYIDIDDWNRCTHLRKTKSTLKDPDYYNTPYLLKDKLVCGICYEKLKSKNYGKDADGNPQCSYRCVSKVNNKSELVLPKTWIEATILNLLDQNLKMESPQVLWNMFCEEIERQKIIKEKEIQELDIKVKEIEVLQRNLETMYTDVIQSKLKIIPNNIKKEPDNKNEKQGITVKDLLIERLNHQNLIFSKLKEKYESEMLSRQKFIDKQFFENFDQYIKALEKFKVNFLGFNNRQKRVFIDLLVDKIIIHKIDGSLNIRMIINPSRSLI